MVTVLGESADDDDGGEEEGAGQVWQRHGNNGAACECFFERDFGNLGQDNDEGRRRIVIDACTFVSSGPRNVRLLNEIGRAHV